MTWNSHGIWCQFGTNCRQFLTWNDMEFPWESLSHFLQEMHLTEVFPWLFLGWRMERKSLPIPVKNVPYILMEIPRHFSSQLDLEAVWSKLTPNSMTIPCYLSRFYLLSMLKHDIGFGQVQVIQFPWHLPRKWWAFHRIWCHFRPNCRQKDMGKSVSHFLQGI